MTKIYAAAFSIGTGSFEPIYRQLIKQISRLAASGKIRPGDEMPSVREVAQALTINPMTVSKAYGILETEGVLLRRRGWGMAVADPKIVSPLGERIELLRPTLERAASEAHQLELEPKTVLGFFGGLLSSARAQPVTRLG